MAALCTVNAAEVPAAGDTLFKLRLLLDSCP